MGYIYFSVLLLPALVLGTLFLAAKKGKLSKLGEAFRFTPNMGVSRK